MPVFLAGVLVMALGIHRMAASRDPATFEVELQRIETLRRAGAVTRANAYVVRLLEDASRPPAQRAELHRQNAITIHRAEAALRRHNPVNARTIVSDYRQAMQSGAAMRPHDWVRLGDAYRWLRQGDEARDAYREALRKPPPNADRIRRRLLELLELAGATDEEDYEANLDAILTDDSASPNNYVWAAQRKVERLLDDGHPSEAMAMVTAARQRLASTEQALVVPYLEALCLNEAGLPMEAEAELRRLRRDWQVRDELWARAGWLLGRIQQAEDRPQAALTYYEDVLRAYPTGDIHDRCSLGRAESLAALERFDRALQVFGELRDRLGSPEHSLGLDRDAVRSSVTFAGEQLLTSKRWAQGIAFLQLGLSLVAEKQRHIRARYLSRIADGFRDLARRQREGKSPTAAELESARRHAEQAAETFLALAALFPTQFDLAARALEDAADQFEAAERTDRMIEVLERLVREYPNAPRRATALFRLAQTHQSLGHYQVAAGLYEGILRDYPRLPDALDSIVPLAECLMIAGGEKAARGVNLLLNVVEDRGPDALFAPAAQEYRQALVRLAEHYYNADEDELPGHFELAITRLEDAIALYPDDPDATQWQFMLADAFRQSAAMLRADAEKMASPLARQAAFDEADRRLARAMTAFDQIIGELAARNLEDLSELEQTHLRAAYLNRADALFDLGEYGRAIDAYREAAWRFENTAAAVVAMLQIVHAHERLGQSAEASAALARLKWVLQKTPESAFVARLGMSPKQYWESLVARLERIGIQ